jgi:hypothetical protein
VLVALAVLRSVLHLASCKWLPASLGEGRRLRDKNCLRCTTLGLISDESGCASSSSSRVSGVNCDDARIRYRLLGVHCMWPRGWPSVGSFSLCRWTSRTTLSTPQSAAQAASFRYPVDDGGIVLVALVFLQRRPAPCMLQEDTRGNVDLSDVVRTCCRTR